VFSSIAITQTAGFGARCIAVYRRPKSQPKNKASYEPLRPRGAEAACLAYVTRLAKIADRLITDYRQSGQRNDDIMATINAEWEKHPAPPNSDSEKMSQLLIGKWESPRRTYVFRRDGKYGNEDGSVDTPWKVRGNKIIFGSSEKGTIILLNSDYLIYAERGTPFFHSRVKD
jgi:hypothetical protein